MNGVEVTQVTLSDCGRALSGIEDEIQRLQREKLAVERKIAALKTQGLLISELGRGNAVAEGPARSATSTGVLCGF